MKPSLASRSLTLFIFLLTSCYASKAQVHFRDYSPGRYYDQSGVKHTGFIDFGKNFWGSVKINFKADSINADNQRIDLSAITSLVLEHQPDSAAAAPKGSGLPATKMVIDSFVVVHQTVRAFDTTATDTWLCKFVTEAANAKIYSREVQKSAGGFGMGVGSFGALSLVAGASISYTKTLYLCEAGGITVELQRSNYKEILVKAFADDPELVQKIQTKQLRFGDMNDIIKMYVAHRSS